MALFAGLHEFAKRFPCPDQPGALKKQVSLAEPFFGTLNDGAAVLDGMLTNHSRRAITGLIIEIKDRDAHARRYPARNNEPGAPSLVDAPILPGASRAVRFYLGHDMNLDHQSIMTVVQCSCD